jgi:hypothetical protein
MKNLLVLLLLLMPLVARAQISLGVTAGTNIGKFSGVEPKDATYALKTGINFGGTLAYRINKDISLIVQPMYSQRGSNIEVGEDTRRDSLRIYDAQIDFLIIPLFIRVDSDNGVTYFISGLEFGIPLSADLSYEGKTRDFTEKVNKIDILASIGMGLRFSVGQPDLMIEFRYYQGLVNFNSGKDEEIENVLLEDFKNNGFQLMAGLEWEL